MFDNNLARRVGSFFRDDSGQEIAEFALILSVFSLIALTGFSILATISSASMAAQQTNLSNAALNPM